MSSQNRGGDLSIFKDDDDSIEVETPDFHFDWALDKDKKPKPAPKAVNGQALSSRMATMSISRPTSLSPPAQSPTAANRSSRATPPPRGTHSARSSLSSVQVSSLTDASTVSGSSLVPTPPGSGLSIGTRSTSSNGLDSGSSASGSGGSQRIYGAGGRKFQRVVSAPISRTRYEGDDNGMLTIEEASTLSSSTASHTATLRPGLTHTSSSSSIPQDLTSSSTLPRSSNYMTPGITERTLTSTARSTGRRLGGLSKFGGPARRVIPASLEAEEIHEEVERASPVLIETPPPKAPSPIYRVETQIRQPQTQLDQADLIPSYASSSSRHRNSPVGRYESAADALDEEPQYDRGQSATGRTAREYAVPEGLHTPARNQPNEDVHPFRPFGSQDIRASPPNPRYADQQPQPLPRYTRAAPVRSTARRSPPAPTRTSPPEQQPLRAVRPAPTVHDQPDFRSNVATQQTAPAMLGQTSVVEAPAPPVPAAPTTRTSFVVNSVPYERLQRLGKGGSSTVYSVLYSAPPKKRIIYALKLVQLDRADAETYQSYTNEIELLKRLRGHDRVIQLIDHQITFNSGNRPHRLMMVMECGEIDFAALLDEQRGKAVNMNFVGLYWEQVTVQAVHKENVVHTDLKPANFVLVKGRLKIIDFGIAKAVANDTVNIQRDQQKQLSYPSDVWSLGCILYQMIYGSPPFQHIGGGPLAKMQVIADPRHIIEYPEMAIPKTTVVLGLDGHPIEPSSLAVSVSPEAIDSMQRCLAYKKEFRLTIPELLHHQFLKPKIRAPAVPPGSTTITASQMGMLVNFILRENGLPERSDHSGEDLFSQLQAQNSLSR
ncbi:uncharacterized protein I303_106768 [Kwoniella dejecticola CBS 10117]|uniref:Protein kinase domain-containing protein n=1 Tax=Kwoniella dejecticola CBS 10117 TaxID=1296121 RepID=A0AAJ8KVC9_9TREE